MKRKIINDPVHGFLSFPEKEVLTIIDHPCFQRLRNIMQMGVAHFVYPGAVHTRFLHSLGACHLMGRALDELKAKGFELSAQERTAARLAILLHDVGHGPFSHALENSLLGGIGHETVSKVIIKKLNREQGGMLDTAEQVFDYSYPVKYLHQLVSGQLDVDRLDYLSRDSFYSGVSEGVIGCDRILKMLTISNGELAVEEKGIYSIEKFIIARHIMYWQVYLHKTVLGAELLLVNILKRAKELYAAGEQLPASPALTFFLQQTISKQQLESEAEVIDQFCALDDADMIIAVKSWAGAKDRILATLCDMYLHRKLYKVIFDAENEAVLLLQKKEEAQKKLGFTDAEMAYFVFSGTTSNNTYNATDARINIALKDGTVRDLAQMQHSLVNDKVAQTVTKRYLCYWKGEAVS
ncbi:MAG TPA: HD domain-containing protein [Chitinophagaceae bacterium]|nr:HD domain-containing protein [Chitinophagaceae bacterium]